MAVNPYFNNTPSRYTQEQFLVEDLLVESIKMYGSDCYYIVRESIAGSFRDLIYGEDPTSKFQKSYKLEMYINETMDHAGGGDFLSKFGLQINESINVLISRRSFKKYVPTSVAIRPREGDLVYIPMMTNLYEIKYVDSEKNFYTLGRDVRLPYIYELQLELFKFSHEEISTGVSDIDEIQFEGGYIIKLSLDPDTNTGNTNYHINEVVYQGDSFANATATGQVARWDPTNKFLEVFNIKGVFSNTENIVTGVSSNASYQIDDFNDRENHAVYDSTQNAEFENEKDNIIVNYETNPFGST